MAQIQYKVNQLAKDLNIKTKDIVDMMSDAGIEVKTQKNLEPDEFGVFFNLITQANQINDIDRYLDGETYIPSKSKAEVEAKADPKPEPKVEEKKADPKPEPKAE